MRSSKFGWENYPLKYLTSHWDVYLLLFLYSLTALAKLHTTKVKEPAGVFHLWTVSGMWSSFFFFRCLVFLRWQRPIQRCGLTGRMLCWQSTRNWWRFHPVPQKQNYGAWWEQLCSSARKHSQIKCHLYESSFSYLYFTLFSDFIALLFCFSASPSLVFLSPSLSNFSHVPFFSVSFQAKDRMAPSAWLIVVTV